MQRLRGIALAAIGWLLVAGLAFGSVAVRLPDPGDLAGLNTTAGDRGR